MRRNRSGARRVCWLDFFHQSPEGIASDREEGVLPYLQLVVCRNPDIDDPLLHVRYHPEGTVVLDGDSPRRLP
jgi:hypothetical protein